MSTLPVITFLDSSQTEGDMKTDFFGKILDVIAELVGGTARSELTIASGAVTPTGASHTIDTEGDAASDDLNTMATTNHPSGRFVFVSCADASRVVTLKDAAGGAGQLHLRESADIVLSDTMDWILLQRSGTDWYEVMRSIPLLRVSATDTNPDFLSSKVAGGSGIVADVTSSGADESLTLKSQFDVSLSSDHTYDGIVADGVAGEALTFGQPVYIKAADGKLWKTDADAATTMPAVALAGGSISADATGEFLLKGYMRDDSWSWTVGGYIYPSTTAGALTQTAPSGSGDQAHEVGLAMTSAKIWFSPEKLVIEIK